MIAKNECFAHGCSRPSWFHYVLRGRCWGKIAVGGGESLPPTRPPPPQWIDTVVVNAWSRRSLGGETGNHLTKSATAWIVTFVQHDVSRLFDRSNLERIRLSYSQKLSNMLVGHLSAAESSIGSSKTVTTFTTSQGHPTRI